MIFDLRQRPDFFDARESCVKANVKSAQANTFNAPVKDSSPTLLHFWSELKVIKAMSFFLQRFVYTKSN